MAPPSPLPPLAGVRTDSDALAGDACAAFDGGLPAAVATAPNCRGRGHRDGCHRPAVRRVPGRMPDISFFRPAARGVPRAARPPEADGGGGHRRWRRCRRACRRLGGGRSTNARMTRARTRRRAAAAAAAAAVVAAVTAAATAVVSPVQVARGRGGASPTTVRRAAAAGAVGRGAHQDPPTGWWRPSRRASPQLPPPPSPRRPLACPIGRSPKTRLLFCPAAVASAVARDSPGGGWLADGATAARGEAPSGRPLRRRLWHHPPLPTAWRWDEDGALPTLPLAASGPCPRRRVRPVDAARVRAWGRPVAAAPTAAAAAASAPPRPTRKRQRACSGHPAGRWGRGPRSGVPREASRTAALRVCSRARRKRRAAAAAHQRPQRRRRLGPMKQ